MPTIKIPMRYDDGHTRLVLMELSNDEYGRYDEARTQCFQTGQPESIKLTGFIDGVKVTRDIPVSVAKVNHL
jgi:hypothetical protein